MKQEKEHNTKQEQTNVYNAFGFDTKQAPYMFHNGWLQHLKNNNALRASMVCQKHAQIAVISL